jgi:hypothetical protein
VCATRTATETALRASPSQQSLARSTPPAPTSAGHHNPERLETVAPSHCHRRRSRRRRHHGSHNRHRAGREGQQTPTVPRKPKGTDAKNRTCPSSRQPASVKRGAPPRPARPPRPTDLGHLRERPAATTRRQSIPGARSPSVPPEPAAAVAQRPAAPTHIPQLSSHDHRIQPGGKPDLVVLASSAASPTTPMRRPPGGLGSRARPNPPEKRRESPAAAFPAGHTSSRQPARAAARQEEAR